MAIKKYMSYKKRTKEWFVAVLYSPGYGGGWSNTWSSEYSSLELMYDYDIAEYIDKNYRRSLLKNDTKYEAYYAGLLEIIARKYPNHSFTRSWMQRDLDLVWVPVGAPFQIREYDGFETVDIYPDVHMVNSDGVDVMEEKQNER